MTTPEHISFYIQVRNYFDECVSNDFNETVTLENVHTHFFEELEQHIYDDKNRLEILEQILSENNIYLEKEDNTIKRNLENFEKVCKFLEEAEARYRYEILQINLLDYFERESAIDAMSIKNYETIIEESSKKISCYKKTKTQNYERIFTKEETHNIIENFFLYIDKSGTLLTRYKNFITNPKVFIWKDEDTKIKEQLKLSKLGQNPCVSDFTESYVSKIGNEIYANIYCEGTLLDCYSLIHEFFHYYIASFQVDEEESESLKFFAEFPSIFFEYLFNYFLEKQDLLKEERSIQIEERRTEFIKNTFMTGTFYKYYKYYQENDNQEPDKFYKIFSNSLEFNNFKVLGLPSYLFLEDWIDTKEHLCDFLNLNLSEPEFYNLLNYVSAVLFSEELIKKIKDGKYYLVNRLLSLISSLSYNDMDPIYILTYLELYEFSYKFTPISERVFPKRLEKLR